jgi:signal transduction histidine kinase
MRSQTAASYAHPGLPKTSPTPLAAKPLAARGSSMFPFIPSGCLLSVRVREHGDIRVGDVIVYPGPRGRHVLVAHRVIRIEHSAGATWYLTRGDAEAHEERVSEAAIGYVVTRVAHRSFAYDARGLIGRTFARIAVRGGLGLQATRWLARAAVGLRHKLPRRPRPQPPPDPQSPHLELSSSSRPSFAAPGEMDPRDSLLRGLKHELRTPLNAILGFSEVLLGELDGPLNQDERENLSVVREAGHKLLVLINEVLDLAAALVAQREPQREDTDIIGLLDQVRALLEERRGVRPVHVRVDGALDGLDVWVDRRALTRVISALGELALAATSAGEISLGAALVDGQLRVRVHGDGLLLSKDALTASTHEPPLKSERDKRVFRLRLLIANKLAERLPGTLAIEPSSHGSTLVLETPVGAERRPPAAVSSANLDDVSIAIGYLAAMGHDLRTPLNAILGFADLLSLGNHYPWSDPQRKSLGIIRERAGDLAALVDDMIDWAKLEAGELALQRVEQPVQPLIERAVETATQRSGARGLQIDLDLSAELGSVRLDAARFVQALVGLLDHAVRSNPAPRVKVSARRLGSPNALTGSLYLEIFDPALEVREQDHASLFAAFRPSHAPTGQRIAGLQLGTSVARALLRAHGGDVWFESRPGRGTTFVATLPIGPEI